MSVLITVSLIQLNFLHFHNFFRNTFKLLIVLYSLPLLWYTGWTQKQFFVSSSYKIKTYWIIFINMGLQIH